MMRLQQAASWTDHYTSLVGDDSDDREQQFYETGRYFDIRPEYSAGAHIIPELPFGFEYLNQVTLREINFNQAPYMGQCIEIAAEERPEQGYKVCKGCGIVQHPQEKPEDVNHKRSCRYRNATAEWENIYLYRELTSEALRILLPVSTVLITEKLATFEACLGLGLRRKFKGNPDHLQILAHMEPAQDGSRRRYLVIYDTVPGGTSFLRDLAKPENFLEVLFLALQAMIGCTCRSDPNKQACYRCLYSYRASRNLELISRELGIEMIGEIIQNWSRIQDILTLSEVHIDSLLESELEQRFLDALQKKAGETPGWSWKEILYQGKKAWEFNAGSYRWLIEPQVQLGEIYGVSTHTRADFVFWPQGANTLLLPAAVYTDGFAYHVRPNDPVGRIGDDLHKRTAMRCSGEFVVWSLSWDDVQEYETDTALSLGFLNQTQSGLLSQALRQTENPLSAMLPAQNALHQLLSYLSTPSIKHWKQYAGYLAIASMAPPRPGVPLPELETKMYALLTSAAVPPLAISDDTPAGDYIYHIYQKLGQAFHLLAYLPKTARTAEEIVAETRVAIRLDDSFEKRAAENFKSSWRRALLLSNLFQFLPAFRITSTEQLTQFSEEVFEEASVLPSPTVDPAWEEAFSYASQECQRLLSECQQAGVSVPIVGYELLSQNGQIIAEAELAWESQKIALLLPDQEGDLGVFIEHQWRAFTLQNQDEMVSELASNRQAT